MLPIETLLTFFTASILLALAPGPDNIFVLIQSIYQGKNAKKNIDTLGFVIFIIIPLK